MLSIFLSEARFPCSLYSSLHPTTTHTCGVWLFTQKSALHNVHLPLRHTLICNWMKSQVLLYDDSSQASSANFRFTIAGTIHVPVLSVRLSTCPSLHLFFWPISHCHYLVFHPVFYAEFTNGNKKTLMEQVAQYIQAWLWRKKVSLSIKRRWGKEWWGWAFFRIK